MFIPMTDQSFFQGDWSVSAAQKRLYVIDDMSRNLGFLKTALERAGYSILLCEDIAGFMESFSVAGCGGVLVDVHLQNADATDVLDVLRNAGLKAPVILTSGDPNGLAAAERYAAEMGFSVAATLPKPFTARQLLEIVERREPAASLLDEIDFDESIAKGYLYPVLQPQLDIARGLISSAELLTRLAHPAFGVVRPELFVKSLRPQHLHRLFFHHLETVRRELRTLRRISPQFRVAVNVAPHTLVEAAPILRRLADEDPALWSSLVLEITEEGIAQMSAAELKSLYKLSIAGAQFSIDDFGSGAANFSRLAQLPHCEIKIDRSIVSGCCRVPVKKTLVKTVVSLAHQVGARVVAEGVEEAGDFDLLVESGCDLLQGYMLGRPMKLDAARKFMADYNTRKTGPAAPPSATVSQFQPAES